MIIIRGVAQPGSALAWGASGRWFESSRPDFLNKQFFRDVAQPGSVLRSGRRGRWFESSHPDQSPGQPGLFYAIKPNGRTWTPSEIDPKFF